MLNSWYVYVIRCADQTLYTGITTDVTRRLQEHNAQGKRTAKYLRGKHPFQLVFQLQVTTKSIALKLELEIKSLSKLEKELMIKSKSHNFACMSDLVK